MSEKRGYIPDKVTYVAAAEEIVKVRWDINAYSWMTKEDDVIREHKVSPTFPIPAGNEKRLETAKAWAKNYRGPYGPSPGVNNEVAKLVTRYNTPFRIQLCDLDFRGQGGRAYKVIDENGFYFDLREDVLFEALLEVGCQPEGHLNGEYLWCMNNTQMKLIRANSKLHQVMFRAGQRRNAEPIKNSELQIGFIYQAKDAGKQIFMGFVQVPKSRTIHQLWYLVGASEKNELILSNLDYSYYPYKFTIVKEHKVVEKLNERIAIDSEISSKIIESMNTHRQASAAAMSSEASWEPMRLITDPISSELLDKTKKSTKTKVDSA